MSQIPSRNKEMVSTRWEHCWQKALLLRECLDGEGCLAWAMVPPWAVLHEMTTDIGYLHPSSVRSPPLTLTSGQLCHSLASHSAQSYFFPPFRKGGSSELSLLNPHMFISISEATSQKLSPRLFLAGQRGPGSFPRLFTFI